MESQYRAAAVTALAERAHEPAGDAYARAAWDRLAEPRPGQSPFDPDEKGWVGRGLQSLVCSAVCYRVAGRDDRATPGAEAAGMHLSPRSDSSASWTNDRWRT